MGLFSKSVNKNENLDELLRQFKSEFRIFLTANGIRRQELEVTSIEIKQRVESQYEITIYLCNLGKLIGKNGEVIKKLSASISTALDKKFFINAVESSLWK